MLRKFAAAFLAASLLASGACRRQEAPSSPPAPPEETHLPPRPAAPLGVFVSTFLSQGGFLPVRAVMTGIEEGMKLFAFDPLKDLDQTFALLEEFGAVLGENIPDLINRSDNRPETLTLYQQGLANITVRARRRQDELEAAIDATREREREARGRQQDLERSARQSLEKKDYATAGGFQKELAEAEAHLSTVQAEARRAEEMSKTFQNLIEIADKRAEAIAKNREALIAGVEVVDVPGIEDLGVLRGETNRARRQGGGGGGGGLFNLGGL